AWMMWELTRDPLYLGYLGLAQGVPLVVFQLFGGVLADRMNRLRLLITTQLGTAAALVLAFILTVLGALRVEPLLVLAAASSFFGHNFVFAGLICLALFNAVFGLSYVTLLPVFADVYFGTGSIGYGLLNAAHGLGALVGTLTVATSAYRIHRPGPVLLLGAACMGVALIVFSTSRSMGVALPMLLLVGFTNTFYLTQVSTFIQQNVPDELRGRVLSLYSLCWNLLPLGGLIGGALAAAVA